MTGPALSARDLDAIREAVAAVQPDPAAEDLGTTPGVDHDAIADALRRGRGGSAVLR